MSKKYIIKSPDGFTIEPTPYYKTQKEAKTAFKAFQDRYRIQGYYSQTCYNGYIRQIDPDHLADYCEFITI